MDQKEVVKEYTNGEVTVVWKPNQCMHATLCFNGLPEVFNPEARPWVNVKGAGTQQIIDQVKKCPSGALSYYINEEQSVEDDQPESTSQVTVATNGPLLFQGPLTVKFADGTEEVRASNTALCRCGASANKPYCDGSHKKIDFQG